MWNGGPHKTCRSASAREHYANLISFCVRARRMRAKRGSRSLLLLVLFSPFPQFLLLGTCLIKRYIRVASSPTHADGDFGNHEIEPTIPADRQRRASKLMISRAFLLTTPKYQISEVPTFSCYSHRSGHK